MSDLFDRYGRWLVHHRVAGLLLCLALTTLAIWAILDRLAIGLPVDFTPQALFMDGGPEIRRLDQLENNYGREDNDVVVLVEGPLATPAGVDSLRRLHAALAAVDQVEEVQSLVNAAMPVMTDDRLEIVAPLDYWPPAQALARATSDPTLAGLLVARRDEPATPGPVTDDIAALRVRIDRKLGPVAQLAPAVDAVVAAAHSVPLPSGETLSVTGVPLIRTEVVDLMQADEVHFLPIVAGLFALTTGILFRRFWSGLAPLFVTLIGTIWALGVLFGAGVTLNVLSALVPVLTVVIGVSDGVHIVARYREELDPPDGSDDDHVAKGRVSAADAMGRTLRHMTTACFLTTFTTAAGFLSLSVAQTRVVRDFGMHCAVAVMVVWVAVMLVLPVWLAWMPRSVRACNASTVPRSWQASTASWPVTAAASCCGAWSWSAWPRGWPAASARSPA
ncbi:MAG: MMPL family transporter [Oligoflexia bacterium]|nr:MMPL family transporter [Oligoflexia bacterium]